MKKQIDAIRKTFQADSNYDWMLEIENKIKSDKKTLARLKEENGVA